MATLTAAERAAVRHPRYALQRYLSVCPREAVFACRSTGYYTHDSDTVAAVALEIGEVLLGSYANVKAGMTLDVGTAPFARDIASVRIRKDASPTELYIAETGGSDLYGHAWTVFYLTVRDERHLWPRMPYMAKTKSGEYFDAFNFTIDYDVAYTNQTKYYPPIVNITGKMAGFKDADSVAFWGENPLAGTIAYMDLNKGHAYSEASYDGATITASSDQSGLYPADDAFDDNPNTLWGSDTGLPQWIKVQVPSAKTIVAYSLHTPFLSSMIPRAWVLEGSHNDADWDTLDSRSGVNLGGTQRVHDFEIATPGSYPYYRLTITATDSGGAALIELNLHEQAPARTRLASYIGPTDALAVKYIDLPLRRVGLPSGALSLRIETEDGFKPSGALAAPYAISEPVAESALSTSVQMVRFTFTIPVSLAPAAYYPVLISSSEPDPDHYVQWAANDNYASTFGTAQFYLGGYWGIDGALHPVCAVYEGDTPDYRTVTLSAAGSEPVTKGASITSYQWDVVDGTFVDGTSAGDATVRVRFPASRVFRYVACTVTDSSGASATRFYPIFVHSEAHPPLPAGTGFTIERDETTMVGREMDLTVYGPVGAASEGVIPKGTLAVYWEEIAFDGQAAPEAYRQQFMGWVSRDATRLTLHRDQYFLTLSGPGYWLQEMRGFPLSFLDRSAPSKWFHMADPTDDRAAATILRYFTTFLDVCGLHLSGYTVEWHQPSGSDFAAIQIEKASIWEQVTYLASEYSGVAGCDSNGDLWLRRHPCMLLVSDTPGRDDLDVLIDLTPSDRLYDTPLEIPSTVRKPYGLVQVDGFFWDGAQNHALRARAPGRVPGYGVQEDLKAAQSITGSTPGTATIRLQYLVGHWYAWLNGPVKDVPYPLALNLDVADPARMDWITVTEHENLRGLVLDQARFLVERVSVQHGFAPGAPPKRITWHLAQETVGRSGFDVPIPQSGVIDDYWFDPSDLVPGGYELPPNTQGQWLVAFKNQIAAFNTDGYLYITGNFRDAVEPTYVRTNLGLDGTIQTFCVDAFSPGYLEGSGAINGWVVTTTRIYRITDIFGAASVISQKTFRTPSGSIANHSIDGSFGAQGHVVVVSYYGEDGTWATYTTDGVNWSSEMQITAYYQPDTVTFPDIFPGVHVSSKTPGLVYTTTFSSNSNGAGYVSTDYGASWSACNGSNGPATNTGDALAQDIQVPYAHNDELRAYHGVVSSGAVSGASWTGSVSQFPVAGDTDGIVSAGAGGGDTIVTTWSRPQELWVQTGVRLGITSSVPVKTVVIGMKRSDLCPTVVGVWGDCPGDATSNLPSHILSATDGKSVGPGNPGYTDLGVSGGYRQEKYEFESPKTLGNLKTYGGGYRGAPNTSGGNTAHDQEYKIISTDGDTVQAGYGIALTDGVQATNISPVDGSGNPYGLRGFGSRWRIQSCPIDETAMAAVLHRDSDTGARLFTSSDAGLTWTPRTPDNGDYRRCAIAGDNKHVIYVWGVNGGIWLSTDGGVTITDKRGNIAGMSDPTPGEFVGICGGVS